MASFDKYAPKLKKWEGGFGNHPADTGGATMCGVTLSTFRQFFGADKTEADLRKMTEAQWRTVMKGGFWDKCWADQIKNQSVAELIVDWCVNSGTGMIKRVQAIVTTTTDGVMGPKTLYAINACRQHHDDELTIHWSAQLIDLCRQNGDETEALRTEADMGLMLSGIGRAD